MSVTINQILDRICLRVRSVIVACYFFVNSPITCYTQCVSWGWLCVLYSEHYYFINYLVVIKSMIWWWNTSNSILITAKSLWNRAICKKRLSAIICCCKVLTSCQTLAWVVHKVWSSNKSLYKGMIVYWPKPTIWKILRTPRQ